MGGIRGQFSLKEQDASQPTVEEFFRATEEETKTERKKQKQRDSWSVGERAGGKYFGSRGTGTSRGGVLCSAGCSAGTRTNILYSSQKQKTEQTYFHIFSLCVKEFDQMKKGRLVV